MGQDREPVKGDGVRRHGFDCGGSQAEFALFLQSRGSYALSVITNCLANELTGRLWAFPVIYCQNDRKCAPHICRLCTLCRVSLICSEKLTQTANMRLLHLDCVNY